MLHRVGGELIAVVAERYAKLLISKQYESKDFIFIGM